MSYVVGMCHPGQVDGGFCESLVELMRVRPFDGLVSVQSGPRIAHARNQIVRAFLDTGADWLLMVDADMRWKPDVVDALMEVAHPSARPIVGALCFGGGRSGVIFPTIYRLGEGHSGLFSAVDEYPEDEVIEVDATGAAFLLMHRAALRRIGARFDGPFPWFAEGTVYKGHAFSEDWAFCLRAKDCGIPIHVHTGAEVGHVKPAVLDATAFRRYRELRDELGGEQAVIEDHARHVVGAVKGG